MSRSTTSALSERDGVTAREMIFAGGLALLLAVILNAPMVPRLTSAMPEVSFGDPYLTAWMVSWDGHALIEQPTDLFDSNTFWPYEDTLAFSDALLGYTPAGLFGDGVTAAILRHNLLYLFANAFAFLMAYLLARELGVSPVAALACAVAFAYAPWRLDQRTHLHVLSSGGVPLTFLLLTRGYRRRRAWLIYAGAAAAIWQISIGFTIGIPLGYALGAVGVVALILHLRDRGRHLERSIVIATGAAVVIAAAWVAWQSSPYFRVVDAHPEAKRVAEQIRFFSAPVSGLVTAPETDLVWGGATASLRDSLKWPSEQALLPGFAATLLAVGGLIVPGPRRMRILVGIGGIVSLYLALGYGAPGGSFVYGFLYDVAPGWQAIRVPGRLMTLASLAIGILAAFGCTFISSRLAVSSRRLGWIAFVLPAVMLAEGVGTVHVDEVPKPPVALNEIDGPTLHLPANDLTDRVYMLWSTDGFPSIANGESGFLPSTTIRIRAEMSAFPDPTSVQLARDLGIETVIFHPDMVGYESEVFPELVPGPDEVPVDQVRRERYEEIATVDISGLGLSREIREDMIIFRLEPAEVGAR